MVSACVLTNEYLHHYTNFDYFQANLRLFLEPLYSFEITFFY